MKRGLFKYVALIFVLSGAVASAVVVVQEFQSNAMSSTVLTNDYTVSIQAGDAVVLEAGPVYLLFMSEMKGRPISYPAAP